MPSSKRSTVPSQDIAHTQFHAQRPDIDLLALVPERGVAPDHITAPDLRQLGRHLVGNAVGKIFLGRVAADIRERQHHDRQPRRPGDGRVHGRRQVRQGTRGVRLPCIGSYRARDILEFLFAHIPEAEIVTDLLAHRR